MAGIEVWITPAILIAGVAFLWRQIEGLRKEMADLRERMARLEGLFEGFTRSDRPAVAE